MATIRSRSFHKGHDPGKNEDMSSLRNGQLKQLGDKLEAAGWTRSDVTNFGQASEGELREIRDSFRQRIVTQTAQGKTEAWIHPEQMSGLTSGWRIFQHLVSNNMLASFADADDLFAIQEKGVRFFVAYFADKIIVGWRGIQEGKVPILYVVNGAFVFDWVDLNNKNAGDFGPNSFGLRRK